MGAAKRSPAPERDRHEEGARSLVRRGFSRVLPGLKDVPGEAAAGAWGPDGPGERGRASGFSQSVAARGQPGPRGFGAEVSRAPLSGADQPGSPGVATSRGGRGASPPQDPPLPLLPLNRRPAPSAGDAAAPLAGTRPNRCPPVPAFCAHPWCAPLSPFLAA